MFPLKKTSLPAPAQVILCVFLILAVGFGIYTGTRRFANHAPAAPGRTSQEPSLPLRRPIPPHHANTPGLPEWLETGGTTPDKQKNLPKPAVTLPDFGAIEDIPTKKKRFFSFMRPFIQAENDRIKKQRRRLLGLRDSVQAGRALSRAGREWLRALCEEYRISHEELPPDEVFNLLQLRADIIPLELALVQAANESAWGTSRFARKGNNLFGQWCFKEGCGIVPESRPPGATYEVAVFRSPAASVRAYIWNLNTHPAYRKLRLLRRQKRQADQRPNGHYLARGLQRYAGIGTEYINRLQAMMRHNRDILSAQIPDLAF